MIELTSIASRVAEFRLHPLGFYYFQDTCEDGTSERVHVWLPHGSDRPENDRHQHPYDIRSQVILGRLRSELFNFTERAGGTEREFQVTYPTGGSILRGTGRVGELELLCAFQTSAGESYFLRAGVIHRAVALVKPCVTTLTTRQRHIPVLTYGQEVEPPFERRHIDANEAGQLSKILVSI